MIMERQMPQVMATAGRAISLTLSSHGRPASSTWRTAGVCVQGREDEFFMILWIATRALKPLKISNPEMKIQVAITS